jgi:hypothetical protein
MCCVPLLAPCKNHVRYCVIYTTMVENYLSYFSYSLKLGSKLTFASKKSKWLKHAKLKIGSRISKSITEMAQELTNIMRFLHTAGELNISRIRLFVTMFRRQNYLNRFISNLDFGEVCIHFSEGSLKSVSLLFSIMTVLQEALSIFLKSIDTDMKYRSSSNLQFVSFFFCFQLTNIKIKLISHYILLLPWNIDLYLQ